MFIPEIHWLLSETGYWASLWLNHHGPWCALYTRALPLRYHVFFASHSFFSCRRLGWQFYSVAWTCSFLFRKQLQTFLDWSVYHESLECQSFAGQFQRGIQFWFEHMLKKWSILFDLFWMTFEVSHCFRMRPRVFVCGWSHIAGTEPWFSSLILRTPLLLTLWCFTLGKYLHPVITSLLNLSERPNVLNSLSLSVRQLSDPSVILMALLHPLKFVAICVGKSAKLHCRCRM